MSLMVSHPQSTDRRTGFAFFRMRGRGGKKWFFFLLLLWPYAVSGQTDVADSLRQINARLRRPEKKLEAILQLVRSMPPGEFRERQWVAAQGISLASAVKDSVKLGEFYGQTGLSYYFRGQFDSAAHYYYASIQLLENRPDKTRLAETLNLLGRLYRKKREYRRAINAYDRAMAIYAEAGDSLGIATIYNESGVVYEYMGNYEEAMHRYRASLNIQEIRNDAIGKSYCLSNIGYLYISLKDYRQAEKYLKEALKIRIAQDDSFSIALNYSELGELYIRGKRYTEALDLLQKSNAIAEPMGYLELQMHNSELMSEASVSQGNFKAAFYHYRDFGLLKDSIFRVESASRIEEISTRYETEKKAGENELLKKRVALRDLEIRDKENQNRLQLITSVSMGVIFLLALVSGLLIFFRIRREQQIRLQAEVDNARDLERRRISRDLHDNLGAQMSYMISVLDKAGTDTKFVAALRDTAGQAIMTLRETVWAINQNEISVENFSDRFKQYVSKQAEFMPGIEVSCSEEIETDHVLSPAVALNLYRLCQEAFSNAVKHAGATRIWVTVRAGRQYAFYFSVRDNGRGFDPEKDRKEGHYGLDNMRYRAGEAGARLVISSREGEGTVVEVFSPVSKQNQT